jgi:hypothetical protein
MPSQRHHERQRHLDGLCLQTFDTLQRIDLRKDIRWCQWCPCLSESTMAIVHELQTRERHTLDESACYLDPTQRATTNISKRGHQICTIPNW